MRFKLFVLFLFCTASILFGCNKPQDVAVQKPLYFNLKGYFESEAARLAIKNASVTKSVSRNIGTEQKTLHIKNWKNELGLFIESDINKPSWRGNYTVKSSPNQVVYQTNDNDMRTKKIVIDKVAGKITQVTIYNAANNLLYSTNEKLDYFPDSLYQIVKKQKVLLLGQNNYQINGRF